MVGNCADFVTFGINGANARLAFIVTVHPHLSISHPQWCIGVKRYINTKEPHTYIISLTIVQYHVMHDDAHSSKHSITHNIII